MSGVDARCSGMSPPMNRPFFDCKMSTDSDTMQAIAWCALPFPQYQFPDDDDDRSDPGSGSGRKIPGHGEARVQISFWFFLFVYYGFYNITALIWITKVFNLYSLNWYEPPFQVYGGSLH